jgi:hypothetical protein
MFLFRNTRLIRMEVRKMLWGCSALVLFSLKVQAGWSQCVELNTVFAPGEEVNYHAFYNWKFIWINAGEVTFSVRDAQRNGEQALHLSAIGTTHPGYDRLFRVRDTFEVFADPLTVQPFEFRQITHEGSFKASHHYIFQKSSRTVKTAISREGGPVENAVLYWPSCTFDILSMVYQARNIDFYKYKVDEKIPIRMIIDGAVHNLYIRYMGKETIKNRDGKWYRCLKFSPLLVKGTIFESGEDMTVWVTDDLNRIPIVVEAKILIGSVKAVFYDAKGLKHPITAEVSKP